MAFRAACNRKRGIMLQTGTILDGRYEILEKIGAGGTGEVYKAYYHGLEKYVIVKKMKDHLAGTVPDRVEVDILKNLRHPYLPQVYAFLQIGGQIFTVMDFVEGCDLEFYRKSGFVFSEKNLICWLSQLLEVLDYMHRQTPPIIHSDIKPANIMIDGDGNVCLIDFNISLGLDEAKVLGLSPEYAAPEQIELYQAVRNGMKTPGTVIDGRTDIYSLGLTFYELMTGIAPQVRREEMIPLEKANRGYSTAFVGVIRKAMQPSKGKRYQSAAKMLWAVNYLEKRPSEKLYRMNQIMTAVFLFCLVLFIWLFAYGVGEHQREELLLKCEQLQNVYQSYDSMAVKELGNNILKERKYQFLLRKDEFRKADIFHAVGDAYFWEENYMEAVSFYMDAIALVSEGGDAAVYYRDAAIGLARSGNMEKARTLLLEAEQEGISDEMLLLARGEIELQSGNTKQAMECFQKIVISSPDTELLYRCYMEMAGIYEQTQNAPEQIHMLEQALAVCENRLVLRRLGLTCSDYAQKAETQAAWEMNQKALECYEKLVGMDNPTYEDRLNYAILCEKCGEFDKSLAMLTAMAQENPDDYVISKRICTLLYHIELQKEAAVRSYERMMDYYRLAWRQYESLQVTGVIDDEMMELKKIADAVEGG